ncbi:MAG: universal stress protein [Chitinophagales bacterium]
MKHFKHILCPYDFSEFSDEAVHYAVKMADENTEITIIAVVELFYNNYPDGIIYFDQMTQAHSKETLIKYVEKLQNHYPNLNFKYVLEMDNDAVKIILDYHRKNKSDLIVIASHGRKGLTRILMGSVAESIFREASCPVLLIRKEES